MYIFSGSSRIPRQLLAPIAANTNNNKTIIIMIITIIKIIIIIIIRSSVYISSREPVGDLVAPWQGWRRNKSN